MDISEADMEETRCDATLTPAMIEAGVAIYDAWEPDHIFDECAADYAKPDLVRAVYLAMRRLESSRTLTSLEPSPLRRFRETLPSCSSGAA